MQKQAFKDLKIIISVFGPIAVLFVVLIVFQYRSYKVNKERLEDQLIKQQQLVTAMAASRAQFFVKKIDYELAELSESIAVSRDPSHQGSAIGKSYDELQEEVDGVAYFDPSGKKVYSISKPDTMDALPADCRYEEYFSSPKLAGVTYVSELHKLPGGKEVLYIARPVDGGGVVVAQLGVGPFRKLCAQLEELGSEIRFAFYDQHGREMCAGSACDLTVGPAHKEMMGDTEKAVLIPADKKCGRQRVLYRPFMVEGYRWYVSSLMPLAGLDQMTRGDYLFLFGLGWFFIVSLAGGGVYFRNVYKAKVLAETEASYNKTLVAQREALAEEKDKLVAELNSIPDGIMLLDGEGSVLDSNSKVREIMTDAGPEGTESVSAGQEGEKEIGGKTYRVVSVPFVGKSKGSLKEVRLLRDVTVEKQLERKKADLVSMITHDVKSPLTAIIGLSRFISEEIPKENIPADVLSSMGTITRAANRIHALMDNFLFLSSVESAHKLSRRPVDLNQFLAKAVSEFQIEARHKDIKLRYLDEERLAFVNIDEDQMMRALANLIGNALKYTPRGREVSIFAKHFRDYVAITVKDNGPGISKKDLPFIFDRHYRGKTVGEGVKGSGLGLSIVKAVVEAHGGKIDVESEEGQGSSFTLRLPLGQASEDTAN